MSAIGHRFDPSILREYDIRGIVGQTLTASDALALGRTMGTIAVAGSGRIAVVGYDGRMSSPMMEEELCRGLASCGLYVMRIGLVPTPCLYFATKMLNASLGIMVTGSHNPSNYNGFKIVLNGLPFYGAEIKRLRDLAARGVWARAEGGAVEGEALGAYAARLALDYTSRVGLKVGWDPGNGAACPVVLRLAHRLPGEHMLINETVDGTFPAHHPDPTVEENLEQLKDLVLKEELDIGLAFDGDGDRIGVVDDKGRVVWGDQLLAILARDVLKKKPGSKILADVKASQVLFDEIERLGGVPVMCPTGHSIIKSKMIATQAPLAGEMSGHIFFADKYYGYDDALYTAVRLLALLAEGGKKISELVDELPKMVNTPEIRIDVDDSRKFAVVDEVKERLEADGAMVDGTDGVRVSAEGGWWLLRASNTQPALVARCEAPDADSLQALKKQVVSQLKASGVGIPAGSLLAV
ncbi:phosphomannomutase/phosphoglucomutase [Rhodospirillaceae bacterium KN72]|uniref:Phosphomannomutase/phosphoglucomutase n=1 Tax=Pacificispira spongiicola TaxID=2729598 RepID=A0A7Y0DZZ0_9PROT|nr:phosphomannomutase/phosphoglucomutase [Pacificispira spongiicola]NMM44666.1 phosphomannomutase/phosphoglucomutase [Pacificispira spongiicola]